MPWVKKTVIRFWCPLGDECGKKNSYLSDAENREFAEAQLEQHLRSQPAHIAAGHDDQSIIDNITIATYEEYEKEYYSKSPPRSTKGDKGDVKGDKAGGKGRGVIGKGKGERPERARTSDNDQRLLDDVHAQLNELRQQVAAQKTSTSTAMEKASGTGSKPPDRFSGESGTHTSTEHAGSSSGIVSFSPQITVDRKLIVTALEQIQLAETNCLDCSSLCAKASTAFNTQAYAVNQVRQALLQTLRSQV
jgi:hypothetical protein